MANWGKVDFKQFQRLQRNLDKLQRGDIEKFMEECAKELAARLLAKVIRRTPVGQYPSSSGKKGGTLRRGWTSKNQREAELSTAFGGRSNTKKYIETLRITRTGNVYQIEIINPVLYASYVEFGHRTPDHRGWIKGQFMLTQSELELDAQTPGILEKKLIKYLGGLFDAT